MIFCKKCGADVKRLVFSALLEDAGAHVSEDAMDCEGGGEHSFCEGDEEGKIYESR